MNLRQYLGDVPLFADLSEDDIAILEEGASEISFEPGTTLFEEGDVGHEAYVIVEGEVEILKRSPGRRLLLATRTVGDVIGEMSLLQDEPRIAAARARTGVRAVVIPKACMDRLLDSSRTAPRALFGGLLDRWKETEARLRQREKMAQLGTLTSGLAHEMNNPAAAVRSGADNLAEAVEAYALARAALGAVLPQEVETLLERIVDRSAHTTLSALQRSDAEAALETWLERAGIGEPWTIAPALVDDGITSTDLEGIATSEIDLGASIELLVTAAQISDLTHQIAEGSRRLHELVQAMKTYAFLDRAPAQDVDIHKGIDDTLLILRAKIGDIEVVRDYGDLPIVPAFGSELNQVWTNLIDNAVDAIAESKGGGTITITTRHEPPDVVVEIADDGIPIPPEVIGRIWDPFFTTKPPGKGTGLGLDISFGIVAHRHGGEITVEPREGSKAFIVRLPESGPPPDSETES